MVELVTALQVQFFDRVCDLSEWDIYNRMSGNDISKTRRCASSFPLCLK